MASAKAGVPAGEAVDTAATPGPKSAPTSVWRQVAGARFGESGVPKGSPTPFDTDFFGVAFRADRTQLSETSETVTHNGFAGGAARDGEGETPVIYGYVEEDGVVERDWHEAARFPGSGYVAAIAWLGDGRALAVGGDGRYPRREDGDGKSFCAPGEDGEPGPPPADDPAGAARAWLYEQGAWREITDTLPEGMTALTAVASPEDPGAGREFAVAGGLCQLWHWRDGSFDAEPFSNRSDPDRLARPQTFQFRVRDVTFAELPFDLPRDRHALRAFAVTAGCCAQDPAEHLRQRPAVIAYQPPADSGAHPADGIWAMPATDDEATLEQADQTVLLAGGLALSLFRGTVLGIAQQTYNGVFNEIERWTGQRPDPGVDFRETWDELGIEPVDPELRKANQQLQAVDPNRLVAPDSLLSILATQTAGTRDAPFISSSTIASPGGPQSRSALPEPGSSGVAQSEYLHDARLTDGDGDVGGRLSTGTPVFGSGESEPGVVGNFGLSAGIRQLEPDGGRAPASGRQTNPDGVADWAVGALVESGQGAIFGTDPDQLPPPEPAINRPAGLRQFTADHRAAADRPNCGNWGDFSGSESDSLLSDPAAWTACVTVGSADDNLRWIAAGNQLSSEDRVRRALGGYRLLKAPSYALNAVQILDRDGIGFAVGNRGAILRFTSPSGRKASDEPAPPRLGSPKKASVDDGAGSVYGEFYDRPRGETGPVPSIAAQPRLETDRVVAVPAGSPDPRSEGPNEGVTQIVMSRDGSEGWAVGSAGGPPALYHYSVGRWERCEIVGLPGLLPADRTCSALRSLHERGVGFSVAARVPNERDDDPANDDHFEVLAIARDGTAARYSNGAWEIEEPELEGSASLSGPRSLVITAPDEAWLLTRPSLSNRLMHLQDGRWAVCTSSATQACGNARERFPVEGPSGSLRPFDRVVGLAAAGDRVFLYGRRNDFPLILYRDPGGPWTDGGEAGGGLDPGFERDAEEPAAQDEAGSVDALVVAQRGDRSYAGWAFGDFGPTRLRFDPQETKVAGQRVFPTTLPTGPVERQSGPSRAHLLRLDGASWEMTPGGSLFAEVGEGRPAVRPSEAAILPSHSGEAAVAGVSHPRLRGTPLLAFDPQRDPAFDPQRDTWAPLEAGRPNTTNPFSSGLAGSVQALAPDAEGGFWTAVNPGAGDGRRPYFFHHTRRPAKPVFEEVAHPLGVEHDLRALAAGGDGSLWLATGSGTIFRRDPILGWKEVRVPGWDPGRLVTKTSEVNALAVGPDGEGVAVGKAGRIAAISPDSVVLDGAAGNVCADSRAVPCGTAHDLLDASIAPDGSAIAVGAGPSLLWRPVDGGFRAITGPVLPRGERLVAVSMPSPSKAWILTGGAEVFRGELSSSWTWQREELTAPTTLRDLEVDGDGRGYAVGDAGLALERHPEDGAWRPVETGTLEDLTTIALPPEEGDAALIGGRNGLILTLVGDRFETARSADYPSLSGAVVDLALLPSEAEGVEAWAAVGGAPRSQGTSRLFHHGTDSDLASPPVADAPPERASELTLAAFGKSDCHFEEENCREMLGSTEINEVIAQRIGDELADRARSQPLISVLTGDAVDSAGISGTHTLAGTGQDETAAKPYDLGSGPAPLNGPAKLRRFVELIAEPLEARGVPLFGVPGGGDLSEVRACPYSVARCQSTRSTATGENLAWRNAMASRPAPWGSGSSPESGELGFERVERSDSAAIRARDPQVKTGDDSAGSVALAEGAATHYAVDVTRGGEEIARLVFVDTSMRSLAASDPHQNPLETQGQLAWVERMSCIRGSAGDTGACTREPDQLAIVVSNTPTYSYGPGALTDTQSTDGTAFEAVLIKNRVDLVLSGRLGWNGLYYATAPGLHEPCPGGAHPRPGETPDGPGPCDEAVGAGAPRHEADRAVGDAVSEAVGGGGSAQRPLPFVVASGAGGELGTDVDQPGSASEGYWHGYSIVRLDPSGDPRETIVEQRPVYEWIGVRARGNVMRPRQRLGLGGFGRSPIATRAIVPEGGERVARHDWIDSAAITHRYALLEADPERPWLPRRGPGDTLDGAGEGPAGHLASCAPYVCLDEKIATVDDQTGAVRAGKGDHPPTFAVAMLAVGDEAATWPLYFEPAPSFRAQPPTPPVAGHSPAPIGSPGNPSLPGVPQLAQVSPPNVPTPPALVPPPPAPPASPPQPPVPPPVPPVETGLSPLSLSFAPTGLVVAPTASVIPPPAPPINPAPPGGARKEARQRQAAAQKGGADSGEASSESEGADLADKPPTAYGTSEMSRGPEANARQQHSFSRLEGPRRAGFTEVRARDGGSPAVAWGTGLTLAALVLAAGFSTLRPRSRRREPEIPAPAWARRSR